MPSRFDDDHRPEVTEVLARVWDILRRGSKKLGPILVLLLAIALMVSGSYTVQAGEQAVIQTFGRESGKAGPGLHFLIPMVQERTVVNVEQIRRIEVGFRGDKRVPMEALMLTGDENIVEAQLIVQYRVSDTSKFVFRLKDPEAALHATAQVALRSVVGRTSIDDVITTGREKVQVETQDWLQKLLNDYQSGISVTEVKLQAVDAPDEVKDAFHDVVRAREEKEKLINQARGYQADLIPRTRGEASQIQREAEAYKAERVLKAKGDADKFESVWAEYTKAERVTRDRLYLETMERILSGIDQKILVDQELAKSALPLLNLGTAQVGAAAAAGAK